MIARDPDFADAGVERDSSAAVALAAMPVPETKTGRKRKVNDAVKGVAAFLGNTPGGLPRFLHRSPRLRSIPGWATIAGLLRRTGSLEQAYKPTSQRGIERAVMRLISN